MSGRRLNDCRLYGILDLSYIDILDLVPVARAMIKGGVDLIQLRGKSYAHEQLAALAAEVHAITSKNNVPLVINDYANIARSVAIEGVHVGQDDLPIADVRAIAGRTLLVGKSTHSVEQAIAAQKEGADYIGFGPLFATPTKPDYAPIGLDVIRKVHDAIQIPIFCIGGIKQHNLDQVMAAGARRIVIVSELLQSENIEAYAHAVKNALVAGKVSPISNRQSQI
jgi:thiamine-phosphate pyrophosphorylase